MACLKVGAAHGFRSYSSTTPHYTTFHICNLIMHNPLNMPEIIYVVGLNIPLWIPAPFNTNEIVFRPSQLVKCTKVCRLWHRTLTPILWRVYSWYQSAHVPWVAFLPNIQHLRFLDLSSPWDPDTELPTRLRKLNLIEDAVQSNSIVCANPELVDLYMNAKDCPANSDMQEALGSLSRLQYLFIEFYEFSSSDKLARILNNNTDLKVAKLMHIDGIAEFTGLQTMENLTQLDIEITWQQNPGLVQLVRFCPKLEAIAFESTHSPSLTLTLARNLRECCPRLSMIRRMDFALHGSGNAHHAACEREVVALIEASPCLLSLEMPMVSFTDSICQTLLGRHANLLENVEFRFSRNRECNVRNLGILLQTCPNLLSMNALCTRPSEVPSALFQSFLDVSWCCSKLEEFRLENFTPAYRLAESNTGNPIGASLRETIQTLPGLPPRHSEEDREFFEQISGQGWTSLETPSSVSNSIPAGLQYLRDLVFKHVGELPHMRQVKVETLTYKKNTD